MSWLRPERSEPHIPHFIVLFLLLLLLLSFLSFSHSVSLSVLYGCAGRAVPRGLFERMRTRSKGCKSSTEREPVGALIVSTLLRTASASASARAVQFELNRYLDMSNSLVDWLEDLRTLGSDDLRIWVEREDVLSMNFFCQRKGKGRKRRVEYFSIFHLAECCWWHLDGRVDSEAARQHPLYGHSRLGQHRCGRRALNHNRPRRQSSIQPFSLLFVLR